LDIVVTRHADGLFLVGVLMLWHYCSRWTFTLFEKCCMWPSTRPSCSFSSPDYCYFHQRPISVLFNDFQTNLNVCEPPTPTRRCDKI
jgi:hypothetical protein